MQAVPPGYRSLLDFLDQIGLKSFGNQWIGMKWEQLRSRAQLLKPKPISNAPPPIRPLNEWRAQAPVEQFPSLEISVMDGAVPLDPKRVEEDRRGAEEEANTAEQQWQSVTTEAQRCLYGLPPNNVGALPAFELFEDGRLVLIRPHVWFSKAAAAMFGTGKVDGGRLIVVEVADSATVGGQSQIGDGKCQSAHGRGAVARPNQRGDTSHDEDKSPPKRGPRPIVGERVKAEMMGHLIENGADWLRQMTEEAMASEYKASRDVCRSARKRALSEFSSRK